MEENKTGAVSLLRPISSKPSPSKIKTWFIALRDESTICISTSREDAEKMVESDITVCESIMIAPDKLNEHIIKWKRECYDVEMGTNMTVSLAEYAVFKAMEHIGEAYDILESVDDIISTDIDLDMLNDMANKLAKYQSRLLDWLDFTSKVKEE